MKIISWNVNSVRIRLEAVQNLLISEKPDLLLLQETKVTDVSFPYAAIRSLGYKHIICKGGQSYNGVCIISKIEPESIISLDFVNNDKRHIAAVYNGIEVHNFYVPAGGDIPDPAINKKFACKLAYWDEMLEWFKMNRSQDQKIILAGDLNVAPYEHDVWSSKQLRNEVSHTDIERQLMLRNMQDFNWVDCFRHFTKMSEKLYSWWSYRNLDWQKSNRGRRLDHIWATMSLKESLQYSNILKATRSLDRPSDHVPIIIKLSI
jgi:exodeoxyribonuclease-3